MSAAPCFRIVIVLGLAFVLAGCGLWRGGREGDGATAPPRLADADVAHAEVAEAFVTAQDPGMTLDAATVWLSPGGGRWLIRSDARRHRLVVHDGETGAFLQSVGARGKAPGQFDGPRGLVAWGDRVFVVEQGNRRVQVLALPGFQPLATFGEAVLVRPVALRLREPEAGQLALWVEDADATPARVQRFTALIEGDAVSVRADGLADALPPEPGPGCAETPGVRVEVTPYADRSLFRVRDAASGEARGAFAGRRTAGVTTTWLSHAPSARFPSGALYAIDGAGALVAFDWRDVARALERRDHCR